MILALWRIVPEADGQEELRVGFRYHVENRQNVGSIPEVTPSEVESGLQKFLAKNREAKKFKKKSGNVLRQALAVSFPQYPPTLLDHAFKLQNFTSTSVDNVLKDATLMKSLMLVLQEAQAIVDEVTNAEVSTGFIIAKRKDVTSDTPKSQDEQPNLIYEDFYPFNPLLESAEYEVLEFQGYNTTVDEFFSSFESQQLENRLTQRQQNAAKKLESARQDHSQRVGTLQQAQELNVRKAQAIEANVSRVEEAIAAVNGLIAQSMDWVEIARLIEMEQAKHNVVAEIVKLPLKLYENSVTLLLSEPVDDELEDGDETASDIDESDSEHDSVSKEPNPKATSSNGPLAVDIDLALSPWSNARQYYDQKRSAAVKVQKTLESSVKALKNTERKINADLKKGLKDEKDILRLVRKQFWFEKFNFFISSDGYLVLAARDSQQADLLYKRYLKTGDVYVSTDLEKTAPVMIKNKPDRSNDPIPPSTLSQAGAYALATSKAWDSKAVMPAWWVKADQVSKTAPNGDYLPDTFHVLSGKNFLPPSQLLLGLGVVFRISEESKARHQKHRVPDPNISAREPGMDGDASKLASQHSQSPPIASSEVNDLDSEDGLAEEGPRTSASESSDNEEDSDYEDTETSNPLQSRNVDTEGVGQPFLTPAEQEEELDHERDTGSMSEDHGDDMVETDPTIPGADSVATEGSMGQHIGVRHLSAKERRLLRKKPDATSQEGQTETPKILETSASKGFEADTVPKAISKKPSQAQVRGKQGKMNKLKSKYLDQDEADRALAMRLLGSSAPAPGQGKSSSPKATKEEQYAMQQERRRQQQAKAKASEEIRRRAINEGDETIDEEEIADLNAIEAFVGTPMPGDDILDAIVICGPWDAIGTRCKWKAKLQPGATKKGKATKEVLARWLQSADKFNKRKPAIDRDERSVEEDKLVRREVELLKGFKEQEVIALVPVGKVRIIQGAGEGVSKGKGGTSTGKGGRGGRGSKKQR